MITLFCDLVLIEGRLEGNFIVSVIQTPVSWLIIQENSIEFRKPLREIIFYFGKRKLIYLILLLIKYEDPSPKNQSYLIEA